MRLQRGAKLAVVVEIDAHDIGQAQRKRSAGIRAIPAFADTLNDDAFGTKADGDRTEVLFEIIDELAVRGEVEDFLVHDPVVADLRANQRSRTLKRRTAGRNRIEAAHLLERPRLCMNIFTTGFRPYPPLIHGQT